MQALLRICIPAHMHLKHFRLLKEIEVMERQDYVCSRVLSGWASTSTAAGAGTSAQFGTHTGEDKKQ